MDIQPLGKLLILVGIVIVVLGIALAFADRIPLLGRLPGDFTFRRDGVTIFFPLATMVVVSIVLTVVINVVGRLFR